MNTLQNKCDVPDFDAVLTARERISPHVHQTPVLTSTFINELVGAELFFKCENLQKTGAFKARGASNAVFGLTDRQSVNGVATHSSGNHGAAISYAAAKRDITATVVMPENAPDAKKAAVRHYGGEILECEPTQSNREEVLNSFLESSGAEFIHPYDDTRVIAGQGTCALELLEQAGPLDAIVPPIGGGGLISGTCVTVSSRAPDTCIYGAEPANADDAYRSFKNGHHVKGEPPITIADGLKTNLSTLTWGFVSSQVSDIFLASEQDIIDAMKMTWQRMKIIIEPSSAVPLAAILNNKDQFRDKRVGIIISGGNVDMDKLPWND